MDSYNSNSSHHCHQESSGATGKLVYCTLANPGGGLRGRSPLWGPGTEGSRAARAEEKSWRPTSAAA